MKLTADDLDKVGVHFKLRINGKVYETKTKELEQMFLLQELKR